MTQKKSCLIGQDQQPLGLKNIKDKALFKSFINKNQKRLSGLPAASRTSPLHKSDPCGPRPS